MKRTIERILRLWNERPLAAILIIALVPRLVAAVFAQGFGMHDDHFGPIEQPFMIMHDISYWSERTTPHGHSIVYPMVHYALFNVLDVAGFDDPKSVMLVVRLLHAVYSLLIVFFGFRIAEHLRDRKTAALTGLVLALFWALPWLSVRNLIEVVSIPPLMGGLYYALRSGESRRSALFAGLWFALAFAFRYQTLMVSGTVGVIMLMQRNIRGGLFLAAGFLAGALVIQGSADTFAWGYPFASFVEYMRYNLAHGEDYTTGPWYRYTALVLGAFIPPMSFLLVYGMFRNWKKTLLILVPVMVFFVLHSYFPNKQERFIFPVIPPLLVLGVVGWQATTDRSPFWNRRRGLARSLWAWFWIVNLVLLVPFTLYYSKKSRVEAMYALYGRDVTGLLLVGGVYGTTQPAYFYAGRYPLPTYEVNSSDDLMRVKEQIDSAAFTPDHMIFFGEERIDERMHEVGSALHLALTLERRIDPSFLDHLFYVMNPRNNKNEVTFVVTAVHLE